MYAGGKIYLFSRDGVFEGQFMIEDENLPKEEWPRMKFTGENFRGTFSGYKQYQKVRLNIEERESGSKK